jgi:hypothetical protein
MGYRSDVTYVVTFACPEPEKAYAQFIHFYEWVTKHHKIEEKGPPTESPTKSLRLQTSSNFGLWQVLLERGRDDLGV